MNYVNLKKLVWIILSRYFVIIGLIKCHTWSELLNFYRKYTLGHLKIFP
jgi:hypothetical protein